MSKIHCSKLASRRVSFNLGTPDQIDIDLSPLSFIKTDMNDPDDIVKTLTSPKYIDKLHKMMDDNLQKSELEQRNSNQSRSSQLSLPESTGRTRSRNASQQGSVTGSARASGRARVERERNFPGFENAGARPVLQMVSDSDSDGPSARNIKTKSRKNKGKTSQYQNTAGDPAPAPSRTGSNKNTQNPSTSTKSIKGAGQKFLDQGLDDIVRDPNFKLKENDIEDVKFYDDSIWVNLRSFKDVPSEIISASIENGTAKIRAQNDNVRESFDEFEAFSKDCAILLIFLESQSNLSFHRSAKLSSCQIIFPDLLHLAK